MPQTLPGTSRCQGANQVPSDTTPRGSAERVILAQRPISWQYSKWVPFTVSHIAAVLPATRFGSLRGPLVISALAVGAMSPDVPYFLPFGGWWAWGHSWTGLIAQDIPVTLTILVVFWALLAAPLRELSPRPLRSRLPQQVFAEPRQRPWRTLGLVIAAAAFGAATHIVWDAFTHEDRFGVHALTWLQTPDVVGPLPGYRALQYGSSVIGLALVAWAIYRWYREAPVREVTHAGLGWRWQTSFGLVTLAAVSVGWWSVRGLALHLGDLYDLHMLLFLGLTRSVELAAIAIVLSAVIIRLAMLRAVPVSGDSGQI